MTSGNVVVSDQNFTPDSEQSEGWFPFVVETQQLKQICLSFEGIVKVFFEGWLFEGLTHNNIVSLNLRNLAVSDNMAASTNTKNRF